LNTFDIVVLVLLALGGFAGFQKGLITGLARFIGKLAALGIAVLFHKDFLQAVEPFLDFRALIEPKIGSFLAAILASKVTFGGQFGDPGTLVEPAIAEATAVLTDYVLKISSLLLLFLLAVLAINILIALIITPLAKSLSFVNRGGGFILGILGMLFGLCLFIGLLMPFITAADFLNTGNSLVYPWLWRGYELVKSLVAALAGDIFKNPLDAFPAFTGTPL
jgi:uncharacterized membrane protein required for colicin V production